MQRTTIRAACHHFAATLILFLAAIGPLAPRAAAQTPMLTVDAAGNPHPINPDIYGIANYGLDANFAKEIQVPNIRWGGDGTTRYTWQVDSSNAGFDWYFMGGNGQATVVPGASADLMINTFKAASNAHTLLTIPIIPWINKSAAWNCSFPVSIYGAQQSTNPYVHPNGDNCGNSIASNGTQLLDTNVYANHVDNSVALQQGWLQHLVATFGAAANGGVPYYQLDNEPGGWSNTHRDVEPVQPDYETIVSLGQQYAAMVKQTDPSAKVFGPVDFTLGGWIGTPSKQNNLYAGQYYLQQMAAYDAANHQRILDYFDEHYYGGGSTDALELADTRSLWDSTYNSGTWVEQFYFDGPMNLLPRFQNWIQTYYPGTKLSISEYSFAMGTNPLVDMLTETDVLGIYGRQSLDFANMWNVPKPTDPLAYSFRIYRNFDGAGGQFGDTAVNSSSTDQGQLSVYGALRSSDGALTVVAINKTTSAIQTSLALANFNSTSSAAVYTYSNANLAQIVAGAPVSVASNSVTYTFPAYSATVFVFMPASATLDTTGTVLTASATQITNGQSVTFSSTVQPKTGSGDPTGTVAFLDGTRQIGSGTINGSGDTSFTTSTLSVGSHSVTAKYSGDSNFSGSTSAAVSVAVSAPAKIATTTSASPSATQLMAGQTFMLAIAVAPKSGNGTPTGTVAVLDGQTQLAMPALVAGAASFSSSTLAAGSHSIVVNYSGDANFAASSSTAVMIAVTASVKIATTTSASPSATQLTTGKTFTLAIAVAPKSGSGTPTGAVTVLDGQTQLAMPALVAGAASFSSSTLAAGSHSIVVNYSGDANFAASSSTAVTVTVSAPAKINTLTLLSVSARQITAGAIVTFTARVAPQSGSGTPTGTIAFLDAQTQIGSATLAAGSAQFSTANLAAGMHAITAAYSGDTNDNASISATTTVTVAAAPAPDYSFTMSSSALTVAAGAAGTMSLTVTPGNGFKQAVTFTCSGLLAGANCSFNPPTVATANGSAATILTIQTPAAAEVKTGAASIMSETTPGNADHDIAAMSSALAPIANNSSPRIAALYVFTITFVGIFGAFGASKKKQPVFARANFLQVLLVSTVLTGTVFTASCAGYISNQPPPAQTKTYTVTLIATAANLPTHSQSFVLTVTP
jgi:Glycoside hydrolase family 44/Bacterial Ig-like domain (group 3)